MSHDYSDQHFSDEQLNAFIDNEMSAPEKSRLAQAIHQDAALRERYNTLRNVSEFVKQQYQSIPVTEPQRQPDKTNAWLIQGVAAGVLLLVGTFIGWQAHQIKQPPLVDLANLVAHQATVNSDDVKLMFQVSTDDPYRLNNFLDETERLLQNGRHLQRKLHVEIVTRGAGLSLVKNERSAHSQRIQQLQQQYDNLIVSACGLALERVKINTGEPLQLLPNTRVVPSALHQVIKRQQEGWIYVNI